MQFAHSVAERGTYWTIGGTEHRPELVVLFGGDPDSVDLHILERAS